MPPGYTFLHVGHLISIKGKKIADQLLVQAENRNPDAFDMYIYNGKSLYICSDGRKLPLSLTRRVRLLCVRCLGLGGHNIIHRTYKDHEEGLGRGLLRP